MQADLILWVGISFQQSASTVYFRNVRKWLAVRGGLAGACWGAVLGRARALGWGGAARWGGAGIESGGGAGAERHGTAMLNPSCSGGGSAGGGAAGGDQPLRRGALEPHDSQQQPG